jgi:hypothetical protein
MQKHDPKMTSPEISGGAKDPAWALDKSWSADARSLTIGEMSVPRPWPSLECFRI